MTLYNWYAVHTKYIISFTFSWYHWNQMCIFSSKMSICKDNVTYERPICQCVFICSFDKIYIKSVIAASSHICIFISQRCVYQYAQICNMTYEQQIWPCVLSPAKSSPMFDWGLPTALKYSKIQISPICENYGARLSISSSSPGLRIFLLKFSPQHRAAPSSFVWWSAISHRRIYWTIYLQEI